jgi:hypothetical protein
MSFSASPKPSRAGSSRKAGWALNHAVRRVTISDGGKLWAGGGQNVRRSPMTSRRRLTAALAYTRPRQGCVFSRREHRRRNSRAWTFPSSSAVICAWAALTSNNTAARNNTLRAHMHEVCNPAQNGSQESCRRAKWLDTRWPSIFITVIARTRPLRTDRQRWQKQQKP